MKERPILFSGPMVRAILAGTKTQTRRIITRRGPDFHTRAALLCLRGGVASFADSIPDDPIPIEVRCPYGEPGARLWVRETLRKIEGAWFYAADNSPVEMFESDPRIPQMLSWAHDKEGETCVSIHMPRWASRLTLEITGVRVERVQDITEADAAAEGFPLPGSQRTRIRITDIDGTVTESKGLSVHMTARGGFVSLWEAINGERAPWASNPWVWVIGFQRITP